MRGLTIICVLALANSLSLAGQCPCEDLAPSPHPQVIVNNTTELVAALNQANSSNGHLTILLNSGTYQLTTNLPFISSNTTALTIKGATGNRDDVFIKGLGWNNNAVTHIFNVAADSFAVADLTIGEVFYHPIQIHSNPNDADYCLIQKVRFVDAKEQLLKVSGGGELFADHGTVRCCLFEFTAGVAYQYYTGGIDAHRAVNWDVGHNVFKHIRSPDEGLAEHAIHFWRESSGTMVYGNHIIDCDRGIGFGLGSEMTSGHQGGIIKNNFVHTSRDVGIGLESAPDAKVYHNTVITENYFNSIEYRFSTTTQVHIANNITDQAISDRSSGSSGTVESNVQITDLNIFVDASQYDYHLEAVPPQISDAGITLTEITQDHDCDFRPANAVMDIGADELISTSSTDVLLESSGICLYPNPVEETFTVTGLLSDYTIEVLDSQGQIHQNYDQAMGTITIDIATLPAGLYYVKIEGKSNALKSLQLILKT